MSDEFGSGPTGKKGVAGVELASQRDQRSLRVFPRTLRPTTDEDMSGEKKRDLVGEHVERCIELWSEPMEPDKVPTRDEFEMMRTDLFIAVGMLSVLSPTEKG